MTVFSLKEAGKREKNQKPHHQTHLKHLQFHNIWKYTCISLHHLVQ